MSDASDVPIVYLRPGEVFLDTRPHIVSTVLGSCVAVCLWDARQGFGGMTHSVLPGPMPGESPSARHTEVAIEQLLKGMAEQGSRPRDLRAKLFGGATLFLPNAGPLAIGPSNVRVALAALKRHRIPVAAQETHGTSGLVIKMDTGAGDVWLRRINSNEAA